MFVHDVTDKLLSRDSNYIVDVVVLPKFGNCSISMRELALGMALKFYTSVAKMLKLKVRKF